MTKLILVLVAALTAASAQPNVVDGQLTVDGKANKFTHVYSFFAEGFFDKEKNDTIVLLTTGPLTEAQMRDDFALRKLARDGKLSFVRETINQSGQIINFTIGNSVFRMAPSGGSTEHLFEGKIEGKTVKGKVRTRDPQKSLEGLRYSYTATFTATVQPRK